MKKIPVQRLARKMLEEAFNDEKDIGFNWRPINPRRSKVRYRGSWIYQKLQRLLEKIHNFFQRIIDIPPGQKFKIAKRRGKGSMPKQLFLTLSGENSMAISLVKHLGKLNEKENAISWGVRTAYFADEYKENGYAKLHQLMEKILETGGFEKPIEVEFLPRATLVAMNEAMTGPHTGYEAFLPNVVEMFTRDQKVKNMENLLHGFKYQIEQAVFDAFGIDGNNINDLAKIDDLPARMQLKIWLNEKEKDALIDKWREPHIFAEEVYDVKTGRYDLPSAIKNDPDNLNFQRFKIRKNNGEIVEFDWPSLKQYG